MKQVRDTDRNKSHTKRVPHGTYVMHTSPEPQRALPKRLNHVPTVPLTARAMAPGLEPKNIVPRTKNTVSTKESLFTRTSYAAFVQEREASGRFVRHNTLASGVCS